MLYPARTLRPERFDEAMPPSSEVEDAFRAFSRRHQATVTFPFFERKAPGVYCNSMALLTPDGLPHPLYRKTHIPHDPCFEEKYYFAPGTEPYITWALPSLCLGPLICWDQWFPEPARICALRGADLLLYPTAIGWLPGESSAERASMLDAWKTVLRGHSITNGVFTAAINRCGTEGSQDEPDRSITFWGHSLVIAPDGTVLAEAGEEDELLIVDLDVSEIETTRRVWPFLRDRRPDLYGPLQGSHA